MCVIAPKNSDPAIMIKLEYGMSAQQWARPICHTKATSSYSLRCFSPDLTYIVVRIRAASRFMIMPILRINSPYVSDRTDFHLA